MSNDPLINIVRFTNVGVGATVAAAHGLTLNGVAKTPDIVLRSNGNFEITATSSTQVTVRNDGDAIASCDVWCEYKHSFIRNFPGALTTLTPQPFVAAGGPTAAVTTGANVIAWPVGTAWADVYTQIQALSGPGIVLVERDVATGFRTMTAVGGAVATNLWNVQFVALAASAFNFAGYNPVTIRVADGFLLGVSPDSGFATLQSVNINWDLRSTAATVSGSPVAIQLDGGSMSHVGTPYAFITDNFTSVLRNGAFLIGTGGTALVRLTADLSALWVTTNAAIRSSCFATTTGARTLTVRVDGTITDVNGAAFGALVTPTYTGSSIYLISPDGTFWTGSVDNLGALTFI